MSIVLIGFSGSGKTTVLQDLAAKFEWLIAADLDHLIAHRFALAPYELGDLIRQKGFEEFRKIETQVLAEFLKQQRKKKLPFVLALGGGAWTETNRSLFEESEQTYFLDLPFEICWSYIAKDKNRPLVDQGKEKLQELFKLRRQEYLAANLIRTMKDDESEESFFSNLVSELEEQVRGWMP